MIEYELSNKNCLKRVNDYQNIDIYGTKVNTPYFINNVEEFFVRLMKQAEVSEKNIQKVQGLYQKRLVHYAWGRGKGTPEEIKEDVINISEAVGLPLEGAGENVIHEFMKLYGLGVDCSGFVYNILNFAFASQGEESTFNEHLDWQDKGKNGVNRAGAFVFAGNASSIIKPQEVDKLDLILIKSRRSQKYVHIAILLQKEDHLVVAQSTISVSPSGINLSKFEEKENHPAFEFRPEIGQKWESLYNEGLLEFRRLSILFDLLKKKI